MFNHLVKYRSLKERLSMKKMPHYGPTRGELWFRVLVSLAGLAMVSAMVAVRGVPTGPGLVEALGIPLLLFGGTAIWCGRKLIVRDHPE